MHALTGLFAPERRKFDAFDGLFLCLTPPLAGGSAGHPRPDPYLLRPGGFAQSCVLAPEGRTNPHRPHGSRSQVRVKPHTSRERIRHPCKKVPGPPSNCSPLEPIERAGMGLQLRLAFSVEVLVPLAGPATGTDQRHSANRLFLLCKTAECNRNSRPFRDKMRPTPWPAYKQTHDRHQPCPIITTLVLGSD